NYFSPGPGRDRARAIVAYEELLRRGHWRSMNNFALRLQSRREFARAESVWRVAIREGDMIDRPLVLNPLRSLLIQHKFAAAESLIARAESLYPDLRGVWRARIDMLSMRGDTTAYRRAVDSVAQHGDSLDKVWAGTKRSQLATVAGRLRDGIRMFDEGRPSVNTLNARQRLTRTLQLGRSWLRSQYLNEAAQHVKELDAALAALPMTSLPEQDRPYFTANGVIWNYAVAGRPDRARAALAEYDATVRDSILRLDQSNDRHNALGDILLAEGKPVEAIAEYRAGDRLPDGPAGSCTICLSLNLARAFDAAGMTDSAIVHYERIVSDEYPFRVIEWVDALFTPLSYRRLGALYESKKDYAKAATNYQKFVTLWANAEPDVQPLVEEARLRLRRMANVER
ncbi:MAG TPA: tetratricopeptide repeat protein, partial [Gemmatimonadaceae bacterium]|nr:tetratricopeptide repeat protein [Gemmatimonadaceae bacterium]